MIESGRLHSLIFWGPPGTGKTTLARLVAEVSDAHWISLSAVLSGVKDIRSAMDEAQQLKSQGRVTVLFVDEVHRFNKSQQDAFLPFVEDGTVIFMGATTENPAFELNNALLSRARIYKLESLDAQALEQILSRAMGRSELPGASVEAVGSEQDHAQGPPVSAEEGVLATIAHAADGDARLALNILEIALSHASGALLTKAEFDASAGQPVSPL